MGDVTVMENASTASNQYRARPQGDAISKVLGDDRPPVGGQAYSASRRIASGGEAALGKPLKLSRLRTRARRSK